MAQPPKANISDKFKLTVGNFTTNTSDNSGGIPQTQTISPIPSTTVPILVSHSDLLRFFFPTTSDIYLYDGSGSVVNVNSSLATSTIKVNHLFFLQNSYISNNALTKSLVATLLRLS